MGQVCESIIKLALTRGAWSSGIALRLNVIAGPDNCQGSHSWYDCRWFRRSSSAARKFEPQIV
jgi:hypothetical protein